MSVVTIKMFLVSLVLIFPIQNTVADPIVKTEKTDSLLIDTAIPIESPNPNDTSEFYGRVINLPEKKVARGLGSLKIDFELPRGYHFTKEAPSLIKFRSKSGKTILFADSTTSGSDNPTSFPIFIPFEAMKGKTELVIDASVFFCLNSNGVCMFDAVRIHLPVKVSKDGRHKLSVDVEVDAPEIR